MRTANPVLNDNVFSVFSPTESASNAMTIQGTAWKTIVLLGLAVATASFSWTTLVNYGQQAAMPWMVGGLIVGLVLALVTSFAPTWSPVTAPLYALAEGFFLGALSAMFDSQFSGIAFQAICLTFGTMFSLLFVYQLGLVQVTQRFRAGIMAATGGVALFYLAMILMGFFGVGQDLSEAVFGASWVGIGVSLVIVTIAALNLVLDFDFIEKGAAQGAPKYMEWYGAFGLMVTLVWLYIELLRLLAKFRSR